MRQPDCPDSFNATDEPRSERADAVGALRLDLDPGLVLRFAKELGRLLGDHLARAGFPPDEPTSPEAVSPPSPARFLT
jgi:hypothetical protein